MFNIATTFTNNPKQQSYVVGAGHKIDASGQEPQIPGEILQGPMIYNL